MMNFRRPGDVDFDIGWQSDAVTDTQLAKIAQRWRYQRR